MAFSSSGEDDLLALDLVALPQVHHLHFRQPHSGRPLHQPQQAVAALLGGVPALQGRGGAAQDHRAARELGPLHGQVPGVEPRVLLALVGPLLLLVHHDQPDVAQGGQHRVAHAHEQRGVVEQQADHVRLLLGSVEPGVPHRHPAGKARLQPGQQPRGEADLRHQPQHASARGQGALRQFQVDLGLAAAGDAVEQVRPEAAGRHPGHGRQLFAVELHPLVRGVILPLLGQQVQAPHPLHQPVPLQAGQHSMSHLGGVQQQVLQHGAAFVLQGQQHPGLGCGHPGGVGQGGAAHLRDPGAPQPAPVEQGREGQLAAVPGLPQLRQPAPKACVPQFGKARTLRGGRGPVRFHRRRQAERQQVGQAAAVVAAGEIQQLHQPGREQGERVQHRLHRPQRHLGRFRVRPQHHARRGRIAHLDLHPHAREQPGRSQIGERRQRPGQFNAGGNQGIHHQGS
jgi:hypothetical protein